MVSLFAIAGAFSWALLGTAVAATDLAGAFVLAGACLGAAYALAVLLGVELPTPALNWQVPSSWLRGRPAPARALVWAGTLGPGLLTRNPYASMLLVPVLLGAAGSVPLGLAFGAAAGAAHGASRALGVLLVQHDLTKWSSHMFLLAYFRWKVVDRLFLSFAGGSLLVMALVWA